MTTALRTIRHQVWTDTRGLALLLIAWAVVLVAHAVIVFRGPADWMRPGLPYGPDFVIAPLRVIMTVVLAVLVVHRDPAVGSTAFWRTRPIPSGIMWASKVAWIGVWLVGVPGVGGGLLMSALGLPAADAAHAALLVAFEQAFLAGITLMAAAVTDTLPHFIVAGFSGLATFFAVMTVAERPLRAVLPRIDVYALWSPPAVATALWGLGGIGVLAIVYLSRRIVVAALLFVLLMVTTIASLSAIRWSVPDPSPKPAPMTLAHSDGIVVTVAPKTIRMIAVTTDTGHSDGAPPPMQMRAALIVSGGSPDTLFTVTSVRSTLRSPEAGTIPFQTASPAGETRSGTLRDDSQPFRSLRIALGGSDLVANPDAVAMLPAAVLTRMPGPTYQRIAQADASIEAEVRLRAYRYTAGGRLALKPGASVLVGPTHLSYVSARISEARVFVTLRGAAINRFWRPASYVGNYVVLHHPRKRQGVFRTSVRSSWTPLTLLNLFERAGTEMREYEFTPGKGLLYRIGIDDEWLAGAELVFPDTEELGTLTRHLAISGLKLGAPPGTQPPE